VEIIHIDYKPNLVLQINQRKVSLKYNENILLKKTISKKGRGFFAFNLEGKKHFISIKKNNIIDKFTISIYLKNELAYSTTAAAVDTWQQKRLKLLNKKGSDKVRFGEILLNNLISSIIDKVLDAFFDNIL